MADTTLRFGNPIKVPYTPSGGAVAQGEVVVQGSVTGNTAGFGLIACIAEVDIANNVQGSVAIGPAVYDVVNLNNAATGATVYWSDSVNKVTTVSTNNAKFGIIVGGGGGGANSTAQALHVPYPAHTVN
jgi:hypothetical protein